MPIYEYSCQDCNEHFEALVMGDDKNVCCPKCDGKKVKKLMSGFSVSGGSIGSAVASGSGCSSSGGFS